MNPFDVQGKVVIVTGAAGNLGSGYVAALVNAGATVVAWDVQPAKLASIGTLAYVVGTVDITDESAVKAAVEEVVHHFGRIDALINNAAMNPAVGDPESAKQSVPYEEYPIGLFKRELEANVVGMMIATKHVAPAMMRQKKGSIINIASEVSTIAHDHRVYDTPGKYKSPAYTASKAAVLGLTRQWAARLGEHNVRVNAVSLGGVKSPGVPEGFAKRFGGMNMLGRMARPGEYDATMVYLCSDASSFMTGGNLIIDGGKSAW